MKGCYPVVFKTTAFDRLATSPYKHIMEVTGIEPVTHACKASILPIKLYPLFFKVECL